ncbi:MAG: hypothetical protein ABIS69_01310 [Sediminibacterium sp.]
MAKELQYIFWFVLTQFVTNLVAVLVEKILIMQNYSVYVVNIVLSFGILSALFYKMDNSYLKKGVPGVSLLFTIGAVVSLCNGDGFDTYNSAISAAASFAITAYCLLFFYWKLVKGTRLSGLTDSALFWIIIGLFTYYTGSFFIFISYNFLIAKEFNSIGILWRFHNLLLTIFCFYTIYGLTWKNYRKT